MVGVLSGLGIYADLGGPVGEAAADFVGILVGAARVVAPVVFVILGVLLIRGGPQSPQSVAED